MSESRYHTRVRLIYSRFPGVHMSFAFTLSCSFVGALLTRFFLGFVEAAFFPGALFLLSKWYRRNELGQRTALLSCGSLISNAFGSLMASGILDGMDGKLGRAAWRQVVQTHLDFNI
jgi:MFS family permease